MVTASHPPQSGASLSTTGSLPAELDLAEAMRIMDVASALRHERETVEREFNRDEMRARLREKLQHTAELTGEPLTPEQLDAAIDWYFDNLHEYHPPPPGIATTLARWYVQRGLIAQWLLGIGLAALVGWWLLVSSYSPISPAGRRARQQAAARRVEEQTAAAARERKAEFDKIAAVVTREADTILTLSHDAEIHQEAQQWKAQVEILRRDQNLERLQEIEQAAAGLRDALDDQYTVHVIAGEGERSAFERFYEDDEGKRISGYYVIVEARNPRGEVVSRRIRNDETNAVEQVSQWAERVPREVYERLKADKTADGILNETLFAEKVAGEREEQVVMKGSADEPLARRSNYELVMTSAP